MKPVPDRSIRSVALGGLGTGAVSLGSDGRFRDLTLNNNRTTESRLSAAPHSFVAVRAAGAGDLYVRRLQTEPSGGREVHLLPAGGLTFRGSYPQVDYRVNDPGAPIETVWSAFAPVIPYDFDASALPLIFFAVQVSNTTDTALDVSILLNWQNTCGWSAINRPAALASAGTEVVITDAEWDRMTQRREGDNERRLSAASGRVESSKHRTFAAGEVPTNALVFGDAGEVDANEDGQYCIVSPWSNDYRTSLSIWDPEDGPDAARFWAQFAQAGHFDAPAGHAAPRAGAVCNRFPLAPGQSMHVEYVVSWYCPRYVSAGPDEGNYYANNYSDARSIARVGLDNRRYFHASVSAWQKRLSAAALPPSLVRGLISSLEVLSTQSIHTRDGDFGLFECPAAPRVNPLRDRWFWSQALLLFFPRLELEAVERMGASLVEPESRAIRISEGLGGLAGGEFVGPGALQVEACASFVAIACRNYVLGGNLSAIANLMPHLQNAMAVLMAQDKDLDGFPDIQHEAPGLDGHFASGLNAITAGLWLVALRASERLARREQLPEADLYKKVRERAARNYDRYFWDRDHGYYTLYPQAGLEIVAENPLSSACHLGVLFPIWVGTVLDLDNVFPQKRVARLLETVAQRNQRPEGLVMLGVDPDPDAPPVAAPPGCPEPGYYSIVPYVCLKALHDPEAPLFTRPGPRDSATGPGALDALGAREAANLSLAPLALWYLVAPRAEARLDLSERRLEVRPGIEPAGRQAITLCTPNGFGEVLMEVTAATPFRCEITFSMDIPQEIACIAVTVECYLEDVRCVMRVEGESVPAQADVAVVDTSLVCVSVRPLHKLATPGLVLQLEAPAADDPALPSKKQWIPQWFRK